MPELTNEDKAVLNCLFRALNQKNKGYTSIKAVKELVEKLQITADLSDLNPPVLLLLMTKA